MKRFDRELARFEEMLTAHEPFALARFGDGEIRIARDVAIDYPQFRYDPRSPAHRWFRDRMVDALRHRQRNYYVAISAPCCVGDAEFFVYRSLASQPEEALTFACLLVNANYQPFLQRWLPLFASYGDVHVICHHDARTDALPFAVGSVFRVGDNAWQEDYALLDQLRAFVAERPGALFLIAAGPFGGMIAQQLFAFAPHSTWIDIGSTLDPFFYGRDTRAYHSGRADHDFCTWAPARLPSSEVHHETHGRTGAAV